MKKVYTIVTKSQHLARYRVASFPEPICYDLYCHRPICLSVLQVYIYIPRIALSALLASCVQATYSTDCNSITVIRAITSRDLHIARVSSLFNYIFILFLPTQLPKFFNVLLTVHPGMILVNNQLDAQFFMCVYFYSLHVSGCNVPIIMRIILSVRHLVYVTLCR